jgi:hypothetical protein
MSLTVRGGDSDLLAAPVGAAVGAAAFIGIVWRFGRGIVGCDHVQVTGIEEDAMRSTFLPGGGESTPASADWIFLRKLVSSAVIHQ